MNKLYADIILEISHEQLDKSFQYFIPENLRDDAVVGAVVEIAFGKNNRIVRGYICSVSNTPKISPELIKPVISVLSGSELSEGRFIALAEWMKNEYHVTMSSALKTVLPVKEKEISLQKRTLHLSSDDSLVSDYVARMEKKHATARLRLISALKSNPIDYKYATGSLKITAATIRSMKKDGILKISSDSIYRTPDFKISKESVETPTLNEEQLYFCNTVKKDIVAGISDVYLLHGITGSGKTLCYTDIIKKIVSCGKQAIMLIPEISLTWQTLSRFYSVFGDRVSVLNSRMSKGERYDQFLKASRGEIDVIVGPRSALFTPFKNLGIICIDEEHESSYKSQQSPSYNAIDVAVHMGKTLHIPVILGSATPSVSSYFKAKEGIYRLFELKQKARAKSETKIYTVDLREELKSGNRSIFSRKLIEEIKINLESNEQTMLFINKRGYAGFVSCRMCGHVAMCPHCDISLTYHTGGKLICHYCGYEKIFIKKCPACGSPHIAGFKAGTQQIETQIKEIFPNARVLRMDKDTTSGKAGHSEIVSEFAEGKADILIGTQMIVKGHDFENLTLVAALAADMSLYSGDFKASERTFQLLTQAAGRSGRAKENGRFIIQTYEPDNFTIKCVVLRDYQSFYKKEIDYRTALMYPPVWHMLTISMFSKNQDILLQGAAFLKKILALKNENDNLHVTGPVKAAVYKLEDNYNMLIYARSKKEEYIDDFIKIIKEKTENNPLFNYIYMQYDKE